MKNVFVAFLTLLSILLLIVEPGVGQGFSFDDEVKQLSACVNYVTGQGGDTPSAECCKGAKVLESSIPTTDDKRAACEFIRTLANILPGIKEDKSSSLFKKCDANVPFTFAKNHRLS
ncbi:hypothetical protein Lal_00022227 [Lupinus albus]|nr:hypothetical protein Lal_00022227 [Lupinus albus]